MLAKAIRPTPAPLCIDDIIGGWGGTVVGGRRREFVGYQSSRRKFDQCAPRNENTCEMQLA